MALPNFLIIGAGKAGTTSIHHYLEQHPEVFMSRVKEPRYFAYDPALHAEDPEFLKFYKYRTLEDYAGLFKRAGDAKAIGEASVQYLQSAGAAGRIREVLPDVKMIVVLRDPADRAYSSYMMYVRDELERRPFEEVVKQEVGGDFSHSPFPWLTYAKPGYYDDQLAAYFALFPREQFFIALYEDLRADPAKMYRQLCEFLEIDPTFEPDFKTRYNTSGKPKSKLINRLTRKNPLTQAARQVLPLAVLHKIDEMVASVQSGNLEKVAPDVTTMQTLRAHFGPHIVRLSEMIGRDLSHWFM